MTELFSNVIEGRNLEDSFINKYMSLWHKKS